MIDKCEVKQVNNVLPTSVLFEYTKGNKDEVYTAMDVIYSVHKCLGVSEYYIKGDSREPYIKEARFIATYLIYNYVKKIGNKKTTSISLGDYMNRCYSAILHQLKMVENWLETDKEFRKKMYRVILQKKQ